MTNTFAACDVAFGDSYFSQKRRKFLVKQDAPIQTLSVSFDVPPCGGSFAFPDDELGLQNRFIIWRSDAKHLYLDEYSTTQNLIDSSISIYFPQSAIIPDTIFIVRNATLFICVATQAGVHTIALPLNADPTRNITASRSVFGVLRTSENLWSVQEFHAFKPTVIATKITFGMDMQSGALTAAVCTTDLQLVRVTLPKFHGHCEGVWDESVLHGPNVLHRLWKGKNASSNTADVAMVNSSDGKLLIYSVHRDGAIRCFNAENYATLYSVNINSFLDDDVEPNITQIELNSSRLPCGDVLIFRLVIGRTSSRFIVLQPTKQSLEFFFTCEIDEYYLKHFMCTVHETNSNLICLWAINHVTAYLKDAREEIFPRAYQLSRYVYSMTDQIQSIWQTVEPDHMDSRFDESLINFPLTDAICNRIFDGNSFAFDIVERAFAVASNRNRTNLNYNDWAQLRDIATQFINSADFQKLYLNASRLGYYDEANIQHESATITYWQRLLSACIELSVEVLHPLGFLHAPALNLYGVVQQCRFTVYLPPDEQIQTIYESAGEVVAKFCNVIEHFMDLAQSKLTEKVNTEETIEVITKYSDELSTIIESFVEHRSEEFKDKLANPLTDYLSSNFSTGLLGAALRRRIMGRLRFADLLAKLIAIIPRILAISTEVRMSSRLDMAITTHHSTIQKFIRYYTIMYISLSVQLKSRPNPNADVQRQWTVAQAYFHYGDRLVKILNDATYRRLEEEVEDSMEVSQDGEQTFNSGELSEIVPLPSRWNQSGYYQPLAPTSSAITADDEAKQRLQQPSGSATAAEFSTPVRGGGGVAAASALTPGFGHMPISPMSQSFTTSTTLPFSTPVSFHAFVRDMISAAMYTLWPESTLLTLPRFLAQNGFYDALKNYCKELEKLMKPELVYGISFFNAIAFCGLDDVHTGWRLFEQTANGIEKNDAVLNQLISTMNVDKSERKLQNTLVDYYSKVMLILKSQQRPEYVVKAAEKAIEYSTDKKDPSLSNVYLNIFMQSVDQHMYTRAVRAIIENPSEKLRMVCLRQLLKSMLEFEDLRSLVHLNFGPLTSKVADILDTRCYGSVADELDEMLYRIAYAYHTYRFDYARAANIMYALSQRLLREVQSIGVLEKRCNTLSVVYHTLTLAPKDATFIICRVERDDREDAFKTAKNSQLISASREKCNMEVLIDSTNAAQPEKSKSERLVYLSREDIARELLKTEARLELRRIDSDSIPPLKIEEIICALLKHSKYDMAWLLICEFNQPVYDLFARMTKEAIITELTAVNNNALYENAPDWSYHNRRFIDSCAYEEYKMHWQILISYLDQAQFLDPFNTRILRTVATTFLRLNQKIPKWLADRYKTLHFGDYLCTLMEYNELEEAIDEAIQRVDAAIRTIMADSSEELATLVPITQIDILLQLSEKQKIFDEKLVAKMEELFKVDEMAARSRQLCR